jgi:hypothetical protein
VRGRARRRNAIPSNDEPRERGNRRAGGGGLDKRFVVNGGLCAAIGALALAWLAQTFRGAIPS